MNQLIIDAGNSRLKLAVFNSGLIVTILTYESFQLGELKKVVEKYNPQATILSSVIDIDPGILTYLNGLEGCLILNAQTPLPIKSLYRSPETLGHDRLANAVGASLLYPGKNVLVADAGTCLKFDFVNAKGEYLGGSISPGLNMRYLALNSFTDKLPLLHAEEISYLMGDTTEFSIHSGVINGMKAEIKGILEQYNNLFPDLEFILTGGDARYFLNHLKKSIFATPELTLKGLQAILQHNYSHGH